MSNIVKGVVAAKSNKFDKFSICVDGGAGEVWYSSKFEINCNAGDQVEFNSGPDGKKYCSQLKVVAAGSGGSSSGGSTGGGKSSGGKGGKSFGGFPIAPRDGQRSIIRQNALTQANALVASQGTTKVTPAKLIEIAKIFEEYAAGDIEMKAAKAKMEEKKKADEAAAKKEAAAEAKRQAEAPEEEEAPQATDDDDPFADMF